MTDDGTFLRYAHIDGKTPEGTPVVVKTFEIRMIHDGTNYVYRDREAAERFLRERILPYMNSHHGAEFQVGLVSYGVAEDSLLTSESW